MFDESDTFSTSYEDPDLCTAPPKQILADGGIGLRYFLFLLRKAIWRVQWNAFDVQVPVSNGEQGDSPGSQRSLLYQRIHAFLSIKYYSSDFWGPYSNFSHKFSTQLSYMTKRVSFTKLVIPSGQEVLNVIVGLGRLKAPGPLPVKMSLSVSLSDSLKTLNIFQNAKYLMT